MKPADTQDDEIFPYKFDYGDPGMFLELYVPTTYEAEVRRVLELGADIQRIREYLRVNIAQVGQLLSDNTELVKKISGKEQEGKRIAELQQVLEGFSIYQGDGAFFETVEGCPTRICKEPVSVVRLMFIPPFEKWFEEWFPNQVIAELTKELSAARFTTRQFLRFWTHSKDYAPPKEGLIEEHRFPKHDQLLIKLYEWLDDIALLVNGYVVHQLCRESLRRYDAGLTKNAEVEIWVGSFRGLAVNKVKHIGIGK